MAEQRHYSEEEAEEILRLAARKESGGIPRDRLVQMAAELGMSPDQVVSAEQEFLAKRDEDVERKKFESHVLRELWSHVATYVAVNVGLLLMDAIPDGRVDWAYWPLLGWGIGIACHIASVFWSSADDEAKTYREWKASHEHEPLSLTQRQILDEIAPKYRGQKLMAIKELRDRTGVGLREAKEAVDLYDATHPGTFNPSSWRH